MFLLCCWITVLAKTYFFPNANNDYWICIRLYLHIRRLTSTLTCIPNGFALSRLTTDNSVSFNTEYNKLCWSRRLTGSLLISDDHKRSFFRSISSLHASGPSCFAWLTLAQIRTLLCQSKAYTTSSTCTTFWHQDKSEVVGLLPTSQRPLKNLCEYWIGWCPVFGIDN